MSSKRYDKKGRLLHTGESQRTDGRYAYKYTDAAGKVRFLYAWRLVPTDKTPAGKREAPCLRDRVRLLRRDIEEGIDPSRKEITVVQLYDDHIRQHRNVQPGTEDGRMQLMRVLQEDPLGSRTIGSVHMSDAKEWTLRMKAKGYAYQSISNYKRALKAAFHTAIQDDRLRKNPFDFKINAVLENDTVPKLPLTQEQIHSLLTFLQEDPVYCRYYDDVIILLGTGMRISELCGLTEHDLDFTARTITVDHQLLKGNHGCYIAPPKTKNGIRRIPMSDPVYHALRRVLCDRKVSAAVTVDDRSGFLFCKPDGMPRVAGNYQDVFRRIARKYSSGHRLPLPAIMTPHTLRHTFCTGYASAGMNPKALQYIMGHANIAMTLGYYAHATYDSAKAEMERLTA